VAPQSTQTTSGRESGTATGSRPEPVVSRAWSGGAAAWAYVALFLLHALTYWHFFVDDEAITLVYARNLLQGHGLRYSMLEGPIEGYSNFLHVFTMAGVLAVVRAAGADPVWVFAAGKLVSLACGAAMVLIAWRLPRRLGCPSFVSHAVAMIVALAGPLAVWSNSTLETMPFALAYLLLVDTTLPRVERPWLSAAAAILVILLRIDGILFAAIWLAARYVAGDADTRRVLRARVVPAAALAAIVYNAWRVWYFDAWLPLPLQTKVLHKLFGSDASIVVTAPSSYLGDALRFSGLPAVLCALALAAGLAFRSRWRRPAVAGALAIAGLVAYVGVVGDWMFGFRFVVALVAPFAIAAGIGLSALNLHRPRLARLAAAALLAWSTYGAWAFQAHYRSEAHRPLFWTAPRFDPSILFGEYHEIYLALRELTSPGMIIAYHEAGLIPFLLDVENIDMLGLTSRVIGAMPTEDAVFTDVGRYFPLTHRPAYHAVHAYLVSMEPRLIVVRRSWMATANDGRVPGTILGGHYTLVAGTPRFVVYGRSAQPLNPLRTRQTGFLENLAHPAYAERIAVNGRRMAPEGASELRYLWQGGGAEILVAPSWHLQLDPRGHEPVYEVLLEASAPSAPLLVRITLTGPQPPYVRRVELQAPAGEPIRIWDTSDTPFETDRVDIHISSLSGAPVTVRLMALRVMGQTDRLRRHLEREGLGN